MLLRSGMLVALLVLGRVAPAQEPEPGSGSAVALVEEAEELAAEEREDEAVVTLWRAEVALEGIDSDVVRQALRRTLQKRLGELDPLDGRRRAELAAAVEPLLGVARGYLEKGWPARASMVLDEVHALAPGRGDALRTEVEKAEQRAAAAVAARAAEEAARAAGDEADREEPADLIGELEILEATEGWELEADVVRSPPLAPDQPWSPLVIAVSPRHRDGRIEAAVRLGEGEAAAGLIFGARGWEDYHIAEVLTRPDLSRVDARLWHCGPDMELEELASDWIPMSAERMADGLRLTVDVTGRHVVFAIDGRPAVTADAPVAPHGGVGFFVTGNSANKDPVEFRALRIGEVPPPPPEPEPSRPVPTGPAERVQARIAAAEEMLAEGRTEDAVVALLDAARRAATVESEVVREALAEAARSLAREHDPLLEEYRAARGTAAQHLAGLAGEYLEQERPFAAAALARAAAARDREVAGAVASRVDDVLAPILDERRGLDPEPDVPADDAALREWFEGGRRYGAVGWEWGEDSLRSPSLQQSSALQVATRPAGERGSARVQVRLHGGAAAALAFGVRSRFEYYAASVVHGAEDSRILLSRYYSGEWQNLGHAEARFSPEAQQAWTTIAVEHERGRATVRVGNAPPLEVKSPHITPRGSYGLYAWSGATPSHAEFRNFAAAAAAEDG